MKIAAVLILVLLLAASGCITVDMGGGSNKAPKVDLFTVNPSSINTGDASILSWEVENASSVSIDPGIPSAPSTGTDKVSPASTTTYILTASNKYGSTRSTALLTVGTTGVIPPTPVSGTPVITSFNAAPSSVIAGSPAVLTWSTANATGAKISGIGSVAINGSQTVYPSSTTTYILEATNGSNSTSASTMIVVSSPVTPPPASGSLPTILSFTASPNSVALGGSTTLYWNTMNATSASIAGYGTVPVSGSLPVNTTGTGSITFSLTASNSAGNSYASTTISVGSASPPPLTGSRPAASLYVSPASITSGGSATLSWITSGASSIGIDNGVKNLVGVTGASGSLTVSPTSTTTYTLTATNAYGSTYVSQVLTVTVPYIPYIPPVWPTISDFHCSNTHVAAGNQAKLYWTVTNADTITIDNGIGSVGASGTVYIYPSATTTYTLMASNGGNTVAQTVTVMVP